eukprot:TRINITY_DN93_c0_g4_i1.p1 TRINITY_DN93_c0_g4~~TRINITY_DN93_c0_g4_i1.p1  ORF type:complete len:600 (-),score=108.37 TRINITY_DN93_c0_g4_i1:441-2240(-)
MKPSGAQGPSSSSAPPSSSFSPFTSVAYAGIVLTVFAACALAIDAWFYTSFRSFSLGFSSSSSANAWTHCTRHLHLGPTGLWEGPWSDANNVTTGNPAEVVVSEENEVVNVKEAEVLGVEGRRDGEWGYFSGAYGAYAGIRRLVARRRRGGGESGGEGEEAKLEEERKRVADGLEKYGAFNLTDPLTLAFARLADRYAKSWVRIEGVTSGLGARGVVKDRTLQHMASVPDLTACVTHIRIVKGQLYFRYGSFLDNKRRLSRANQGLRMIVDAIERFQLQDLNAELYLNACDEPMSYDNSIGAKRAGFPVFSSTTTGGSTDFVIPDPLDLAYPPRVPGDAQGVKWKELTEKAVFRGASSNFELKGYNFLASGRIRLHYMTDVRPDLLDARITMFGSKDQKETREYIIRNGFYLGNDMKEEELRMFKYWLVADEAVGTTGMCEALSRRQVVVRQSSAFTQFFDPLLLPGIHHVETERSFRGLFDLIEWMKDNDDAMQAMIERANKIVPLLCSRSSRLLYWAVALAKYTELSLEEPEKVVVPKNVCRDGLAILEPTGTGEVCEKKGDKCGDFCIAKKDPDEWTWLSGEALAGVERLDPFQSS